MSDREEFHDSHVGDEDSESEEVAFRTTPATSPATQPELITRSDPQEIIEGWEEKFHKLTECVCDIPWYIRFPALLLVSVWPSGPL